MQDYNLERLSWPKSIIAEDYHCTGIMAHGINFVKIIMAQEYHWRRLSLQEYHGARVYFGKIIIAQEYHGPGV